MNTSIICAIISGCFSVVASIAAAYAKHQADKSIESQKSANKVRTEIEIMQAQWKHSDSVSYVSELKVFSEALNRYNVDHGQTPIFKRNLSDAASALLVVAPTTVRSDLQRFLNLLAADVDIWNIGLDILSRLI